MTRIAALRDAEVREITAARGPHTFHLDASELRSALAAIERCDLETEVLLRSAADGVEVTVRHEHLPLWETFLVAAGGVPADAVAVSWLTTLVASSTATAVATVTTLDTAPLPEAIVPRPATTDARRLQLPPSLPPGSVYRLDGLAVHIPTAIHQRFVRMGVSIMSLYAVEGRWFLSGVRDGRPLHVLTGEVAVY